MPETRVQQEGPRLVRLSRYSFLEAGQDDFSQPPSEDADRFQLMENVLLSIDGTLRKRWGMTRFDSAGTPVSLSARVLSEYRADDGSKYRLVLSGAEGGTRKVKTCDADGVRKNAGVWTVASTTDDPRQVTSRDYAYFASGTAGDLVKYDGNDAAGSGATSWGLPTPATAPTATVSGSGVLSIVAWRDYAVAFQNTTTGHISDFGPFVRVETFTNKAQVSLTSVPLGPTTLNGIATGINQRIVLATSDGGARTRLYKVGTIADNTTTTFTDTVREITLLAQDVYAEVGVSDGLPHGIINNAPPPAGRYPTKHRGRLFLLVNRKLRFSKNQDEISTSSGFELGGRYEEAWPAEYELDVSALAQDPVGLLSDGTYLYILAKNGLYKLTGEGPLTFRPPELLFRYTGVQSQGTIDVVYRGGAPVGMLWVSPDRQVIFSDGNTYSNITWDVKVKLDAMPAANLGNVRVKYGSYDGNNLCFIAAPETGATIPTLLLVYNLDRGRWAQWRFPATQAVDALHFWMNPTTSLAQILWGNDAGTMFRFDTAASQDRTSADAAVSFTATLRSAWLDFGAPAVRKFLQEMELDTSTSVGNLSVSVDGASRAAQFAAPLSVVSAAVPTTSPFGEFRVALAGKTAKSRFYRWKLAVSADVAAATPILRSYSLTAVPLNTQ